MISMHTSPLQQPGTGDAGGMNVYVAHLAREIARTGTPVTVWSTRLDPDLPARVVLAPGLEVHHVSVPGADVTAKNDLRHLATHFARAVAERLDGGVPQILHAHYWLSGLAALELRRMLAVPVPVVATLHTAALVKNLRATGPEDQEPDFRIAAERSVIASCDAVIANTDVEADQIIDLYGARPDQLHVIAPGVDQRIFHPPPAADTPQVGEGERAMIVMAARLQPLKGPELLIDAAALLRTRRPDLDFGVRIIGDGAPDYVAGLRQRAAGHGLGDVIDFRPPMPAQALADQLRQAAVVAVPSSTETFGLVALEAQACGTAVVASRVDGLITAVADEESGILVPTRTPQAWAEALERVLADPALRAELGRNGVRRAADLTWEAAARRTVTVYREVISARAPRE